METRWSLVQPIHSIVASRELRYIYEVYNREVRSGFEYKHNTYSINNLPLGTRVRYLQEKTKRNEYIFNGHGKPIAIYETRRGPLRGWNLVSLKIMTFDAVM